MERLPASEFEQVPVLASKQAHELVTAQAWEQKGQRLALASAWGPVQEPALEQVQVPEQAWARELERALVQGLVPEQVSRREHFHPSLCPSRATRFPSIQEQQQLTKLLT